MLKKVFAISIILILFIFGCNNRTSENGGEDIPIDSLIPKEAEISEDMIRGVISSVPNPVTMSTLLEKSGVVYSSDLLNPVENIDKYTTNYKKAMNLGTYGTDLVHMNIYDRTVSTVLYLKNIKDLANDLGLSQFFDYETLNRLSENTQNIDSILLITSTGFDRMTNFLLEQKRGSIAILLSYGIWIESLHLATNADKVSNREAVYERIGEQKEVMDNIIILLSAYQHQPEFKELVKNAEMLKKEFDKVTITYHYKPPTKKVVDGMLVIVDNSTSEININEEIVNGIAEAVKSIRNKMIH